MESFAVELFVSVLASVEPESVEFSTVELFESEVASVEPVSVESDTYSPSVL